MADGALINSLVREAEILGLLRWYYYHPLRYGFRRRFECLLTCSRLVQDFPDGIIPIDRAICAKAGVPAQVLRDEAVTARARGCSSIRVLVIRIKTHNRVQEVLGLPDLPVEDGWRIDGIQPFSRVD
jgi:hypothetical protein